MDVLLNRHASVDFVDQQLYRVVVVQEKRRELLEIVQTLIRKSELWLKGQICR